MHSRQRFTERWGEEGSVNSRNGELNRKAPWGKLLFQSTSG